MRREDEGGRRDEGEKGRESVKDVFVEAVLLTA